MVHRCDLRCLHCRRRVADSFRQKQKAMMKAPCKNCERRTVHPNCHATCKEYAEYTNERQKYRAEKQKQSVIAEYVKTKHAQLEKRDRRR